MELLKNKKSLIPSLIIPKTVSYFAKTLELISSRLASFFGIRLFITPVNFPIPKREQYMLKSAQKKRLYIPEIKKEIEILSYGYSKKKVLLVHGWSGRSTQLFAFADKLLENGYMVISFDGPAHGKSTGRTTMMPEFLKTIEKINTTFGPFEAAIGHSFGATSLYNAAATFLDIKTFIAIGSGDRISDIISNFAKKLFSDYQVVLAMDIDEFLVLDPIKNTSLKDYLLQDFSTSSRSALGLDVGQHPVLENSIDHNKTFLSQREFAQLSSRYTKPIVAFKPLKWGSGFHRVKGKNYTIDNHLYLFHFGLVDYLSATSKASNKEIKDAGWKDHLDRRFNLYRLLKIGIIHQESFIEKGRKTLQKKRSWFAWNKPAPLKGHALIKIPERFNSIV